MPSYRYGGYQYDTNPRKLEPEYEPQKEKNIKKKQTIKQQPKKQTKMHAKIVMYIFVVFSALLAISYQNSLINETFNSKENLKTELSAIQKENEQLRVGIENNLNLSNIEKLAKEKLGMKKLDSSQKVYVSLPKTDYVESASEQIIVEEETNWFQKLIKNIF